MKTAMVKIKGISSYSQSRYHGTPKKDKESPEEYEKRTWCERLHVNEDGLVFVPQMALKLCLEDAARYLGLKIKGRGNATWTKHFEAGVLVLEGPVLHWKKEDVPGEWLFVPSDGKKGGGKRVLKKFPYMPEWAFEAAFLVLDDTITKDIFELHLHEAGKFIGLGRFRPRRGGFYGRFEVESVRWS